MSPRSSLIRWLLLLLLLVCSSSNAQEGAKSSFITVEVTDASGAEVSNAEIQFVEQLTAAKSVRPTNGNGWMIIELHPGEYALSVKSPGFRSLTRQIAVKAGENQKIGFILQVQSCPPGPCIEVTRASPSAITPQVQPEPKILSITSLKLFAWQDFNKKKKYVEVQDFQETQNLRLLPSEQFDVVCEVMGETNLWAQDFFLWTTVDFLIAPVTRAYEQMDNNELGLNIGWGQLTEMRDLQVIPVYSLRREETRELVVKDLDLRPVLAAFPVRDAGNLWPWLIHVTAHFQDRSGKQVAFAERTLRLSPSSARKTSHYKDPPPGR